MRYLLLPGLAALVVGCGQSGPAPVARTSSGPLTADPSTDLLEPLVLPQKPAQSLSVRDVLGKKDGETVVVTGHTPPEKVKPYNPAVAATYLMAPEDLAREEIKEEFDCDDAATCPTCKGLLDEYAVRVELVDAKGAILPTTLAGFRGLKPGSPITVEGVVKRDGKEGKTVRIVATRFYPG